MGTWKCTIFSQYYMLTKISIRSIVFSIVQFQKYIHGNLSGPGAPAHSVKNATCELGDATISLNMWFICLVKFQWGLQKCLVCQYTPADLAQDFFQHEFVSIFNLWANPNTGSNRNIFCYKNHFMSKQNILSQDIDLSLRI